MIHNSSIKHGYQRGYSLLELLVALLLSSVLMVGISTAYSSITGLVQTSKNIENAQEVLRYCAEVFSRSLKQTSETPTITNSNQLSVAQSANSIACDGSRQVADFTEVFTLVDNHLKCDVGDGDGAKIILTGVESIDFSQTEQLMSVTVEPQAQIGEASGIGPASAVQIDIALSEIILIKAIGV